MAALATAPESSITKDWNQSQYNNGVCLKTWNWYSLIFVCNVFRSWCCVVFFVFFFCITKCLIYKRSEALLPKSIVWKCVFLCSLLHVTPADCVYLLYLLRLWQVAQLAIMGLGRKEGRYWCCCSLTQTFLNHCSRQWGLMYMLCNAFCLCSVE